MMFLKFIAARPAQSRLSAAVAQLAAVMLFLLAGSAGAQSVYLNSQEQQIANYMAGSGQHRAFVTVDPILTMVARAHAQDMASRHYFAHVDPDGHGPNWKVAQAGYKLPASYLTDAKLNYVESVAAGRTSASDTWKDWMNSAPHKEHLLASNGFYTDQTSIGVGYVYDPKSQYGAYWVVITCPPQSIMNVTAPANASSVSSSNVFASGITTASLGASQVLYRVENAAGITSFQPANGVTNWSANVSGLAPGVNTLRFRAVNSAGVSLMEVVRTVVYLVPTTLNISVNGQGSVTPGMGGTSTRNVGLSYAVNAIPAPGMLFANWSGSINSKTAFLRFTMTPDMNLTANFVPNPFPALKGNFTGLVSGNAGRLRLTLAGNGAFSGGLFFNGTSNVVTGTLNPDGTATVTIARPGLSPLTVNLQLDMSGNGGVTGSVSDGTTTASIDAGRAYNQAVSGAYAKAGRYTVVLPSAQQNSGPAGIGFGTLVIGADGTATLAGALADGRAFTSAGSVTTDGEAPVFAVLAGANSLLTGSLQMVSSEQADLQGSVHWKRAAIPGSAFHPEAINVDLPLIGSKYVAPTAGKRVLDVAAGTNNSELVLADGNIGSTVTQPATLNAANQVVLTQRVLPGLNAVINPANGLYSGSFVNPVTKQVSPIRGALFQKQDAGWGYYLGGSVSGVTSFGAASH